MIARLAHDAAHAASVALLDTVKDCLRPESRQDFYEEAYCICKAAIEAYSIQAAREQHRLNPSAN